MNNNNENKEELLTIYKLQIIMFWLQIIKNYRNLAAAKKFEEIFSLCIIVFIKKKEKKRWGLISVCVCASVKACIITLKKSNYLDWTCNISEVFFFATFYFYFIFVLLWYIFGSYPIEIKKNSIQLLLLVRTHIFSVFCNWSKYYQIFVVVVFFFEKVFSFSSFNSKYNVVDKKIYLKLNIFAAK